MGIFHGMGIPMIPARREIPGRERFEAIREGTNGNFPLNIPASCLRIKPHQLIHPTLGQWPCRWSPQQCDRQLVLQMLCMRSCTCCQHRLYLSGVAA